MYKLCILYASKENMQRAMGKMNELSELEISNTKTKISVYA